MSFTSFAMGAVTTLTIVALIADVGPEHVAIATSCEHLWLRKVFPAFDLTYFLSVSYVFRTIGQVLGVALSGALTQAVLTWELEKRIRGPNAEEVSCTPKRSSFFLTSRTTIVPQIIASIRESSASIRYLPEPLKSIAIASYQKGLHAVFICTVVLSVITLLSGLGIRELDMKQIMSGGKQAKQVQNESEEEEA